LLFISLSLYSLNFVIGVEFFGIARGIHASSGMHGSLLVVSQEGCIAAMELCLAFSDDKGRLNMEFCISQSFVIGKLFV